jgi:hypothetical protein
MSALAGGKDTLPDGSETAKGWPIMQKATKTHEEKIIP